MNSFKNQLIFGTAFLLTIIVSIFMYFIVDKQNNFIKQDFIKHSIERTFNLSISSKPWIMSNDYSGLQEVIDNFSQYSDISFSAIINLDGKVIAHTNTLLIGKYISDETRIKYLKDLYTENISEKVINNKEYIDVLRAVYSNNTPIGIVHMRINQSNIKRNIDRTIVQGQFYTIFAFLLSLLFSYLISNRFIIILTRLGLTMKEVRNGNRDIKADENVVKEISVLASEFNSMLATINKTELQNEALKERLEFALEGSQDGLWDWNLKDNTIYFSSIWKSMLGYKDYELDNVFESWQKNVHPDDLEKAKEDIFNYLEGKTSAYKNVHRLKHKDGHWVWILDRGKAIFDDNGKPVRFVGTHADITNEKELELKYIHQAQIIEQTHDSVISTDLNGVITNWNHGSETLFGYSQEEMIGRNIKILYPDKKLDRFKSNLQILIEDDEYNEDITLINKLQIEVSVALSLSLLRDEKGEPLSVVSYSQDISERKRVEQELFKQKDILQYQAHHDTLTKLPNRALFYDRLTQSIENSKRLKNKIAVFFIDLDRFKDINDSLGHDCGDNVLQIIAKRLKNIVRKSDTLARLGGDEFTLLIEHFNNDTDVSMLAEKILNTLVKPIEINGHTLYVTTSIGISLYPKDDINAINLLKYADAAMYKAKERGRNNFQYYSPEMTKKALNHIALESALRDALTNNQLEVYFQPQVDGLENRIIGMEALVRWNHPEKGIIPPCDFIPLAENTGLIIPLDKWVMNSAMRHLSNWYKKGLNPGKLSLNLSMKQLELSDCKATLENLIKETNCLNEWIEVEVTESQIMTNPEKTISILKQISKMNIKIAVDDFGTGYSSLSYLKKLPIDKLKIDQSFVRNLPNNNEDIAIAKAVIALANSLNLNVIAEGVETKEQKDFLIANGCREIQGYYYSKPITASQMEEVLIKGLN